MKQYRLIILLLLTAFHLLGQTEDEPPKNPIDGKCYAKSTTPDKYEIVEKKVLVQEATTQETLIPPVYDTVQQRVLIKEAHVKYVPIPAVYDTIEVKVPKKEKALIVDEIYETVVTKTKTNEKDGKWVKVKIPNCYSANEEDCYSMRWVSNKPQYTSKEYLKEIRLDKEAIEGEYEIIKKQVLKKPAGVKEVYVPAEYKNMDKVVLIKHARKKIVNIPARYRNIKEKKLVKKGGDLQWVEVICSEALTEIVVSQVQLALKGREFYDGSINGKLDATTQSALEEYQRQNNLPVGRLDKYTIEALGFNYVIFSKPVKPRS